MSCPDCFKGTIHEGTPRGKETKLLGRDTYVTEPPVDLSSQPVKGVIVILSDAFGWTFANSRILADEIARKGHYRVYLPDFFDGRYAPLSLLDTMPKLSESGIAATLLKPYYGVRVAAGIGPFLFANRPAVSMPKIVPFIENLRKETREQGLQLGVAGYCWGGKPAVNLAHGELVDCVFVAHPSGLALPDEIEKIRVPFSMAIGDIDMVMGIGEVEKAKVILERKGDVPSETVVYPGAKHGFAVRGNPGDEKEKEQGIEAEDQAVKWFAAHLRVT